MDRTTKIIVVDDNDAVRNSLCLLLQFSGYETNVFGSAEECLAWKELSQADCLVVDLRLPKMDGFQMAKRVRSLGLTTPIIFMSGNVDAIARRSIKQIENSVCLSKPCPPKDLLDLIGDYVQQLESE